MSPTVSIPDFTLLRQIGGGGYGEVWLARTITGVYRAVKIIERSRFEDDRPFYRELEGITRFQQALGDQPRQLALLHVGRDEQAGILYYVMELADDADAGTSIDPDHYVPLTLKELRRRRHVVRTADCVRIGTELASALAELHDTQLLHRDVKPSNVIFVNGRAKLADIGLVAAADYTVSSIGTPAYAPPEGSGSVRADLFSLGKILYELSTGLHPDEFPRLPADIQNRPDAAELMELNEVVLRACAPDPAQRYPDAATLLADLRLLQAGRSVLELNHTRRQLRLLFRSALIVGAMAAATIVVLAARNYLALRALAAQETAIRKTAETNERLARYTSDLQFAQLALSNGDIGGAGRALRRQIPGAGTTDLRGLEWYALSHRTAGDAARVFGTVGGEPVSAVALSAGGDAAIIIQRANTNHAVRVDLATGDRQLIAADCDGLAGFDSQRGELLTTRGDLSLERIEVGTLRRQSLAVRGILLGRSPDNRHVLFAHDQPLQDTLFVFDAFAGRIILEWKPAFDEAGATFSRAALSPGGLVAASLTWPDQPKHADEVIVRDVHGEGEQARLPGLPTVAGMRFAPDGRQLALVTPAGVWVANINEGTPAQPLAPGTAADVVDFSPDGSLLAVGGGDGALTIWSVAAGVKRAVRTGHEGAILCLQWFPDGQKLITGGIDGTFRLWDLANAPAGNKVTGFWTGALGSLVLSAGGRYAAVTSADGSVVIIERTRFGEPLRLPGAFIPLAFTANDTGLISLSSEYRLLETTLAEGTTRPQEPMLTGDAQVTAFAVSANTHYAAFGRASGEVRIWDLGAKADTGWTPQVTTAVHALAISDDGLAVAIGDYDMHLQVATRRDVIELPTAAAIITGLTFTQDGTHIATGNERGQLVIWDWRRRHAVAELQVHTGEIRSLEFTARGSRLVSAGADGSVAVCLTEPWRWLASWRIDAASTAARPEIYRVAVTPSGGRIAALTERGELQQWDCAP